MKKKLAVSGLQSLNLAREIISHFQNRDVPTNEISKLQLVLVVVPFLFK